MVNRDGRDRHEKTDNPPEQGHTTWIQTESIKKSGERESLETRQEGR
jgi:hypothetical protein